MWISLKSVSDRPCEGSTFPPALCHSTPTHSCSCNCTGPGAHRQARAGCYAAPCFAVKCRNAGPGRCYCRHHPSCGTLSLRKDSNWREKRSVPPMSYSFLPCANTDACPEPWVSPSCWLSKSLHLLSDAFLRLTAKVFGNLCYLHVRGEPHHSKVLNHPLWPSHERLLCVLLLEPIELRRNQGKEGGGLLSLERALSQRTPSIRWDKQVGMNLP